MIIQYRNPRRPDEGGTRIIPNQLGVEADAEKDRLEKLGFVIIDISVSEDRRSAIRFAALSGGKDPSR